MTKRKHIAFPRGVAGFFHSFTKVCNANAVIRSQKNVRWFQVTMKNVLRMNETHSVDKTRNQFNLAL